MRQAGFDDLRVAVIALVVLVHANVTYSGIGSWYYVENPTSSLDPAALVVMGTLGMFLQAWFMGVLFFVAGLMAAPSLDRKGPSLFLRDRAVRLLGPFFFYMLVLGPLMLWAFHPSWLPRSAADLLSGSGPLWFTGALFVFSAVWVLGVPRSQESLAKRGAGWERRGWFWVVVALVIGGGAWVVRILLPMGTSVFNFQLCFFVGYVVLFAAGVWVSRGGRFDRLPSSWARMVWVAPLVSVPLLILLLVSAGALAGDRTFLGGGTLASLGYSIWEGSTAVAMTLGLAVRARDRSTRPKVVDAPRWRRGLRSNGFGIYVFHAPVLWGLGLALAGLPLWAPAKALSVAVLAFGVTFGLSAAARRIPGLGKLLA